MTLSSGLMVTCNQGIKHLRMLAAERPLRGDDTWCHKITSATDDQTPVW